MAGGDNHFKNLAIVDPSFHGAIYASNHIALNIAPDTGQSVALNCVNGWVVYYDTETKTVVKFASTAPTYTMTTSFSNFASLDVEPTIADLAYVLAHPDCIARLHFGETVVGLSFDISNIEHWYPGCEGYGDFVYDICNLPAPISWEWETTTSDEVLEIPTTTNIYNMEIDWGDGTIEEYRDTGATKPSHIYTDVGLYIVIIKGHCEQLKFSDTSEAAKVTRILNFGETHLVNCDSMYLGTSPSIVIFEDADTSNVTNMSRMMSSWSNITTPPNLTNFNTSNVTTMYAMMYGWTNITTPPDLTNFDTSNVTNMHQMMYNWSNMTTPPDLTGFNTSNVTTMSYMMSNWSNITTPPDLTNFDTSNVTNMYYMMYNWSNITTPPDLTNFDTSNVTNMSRMMQSWTNITTPPDLTNFDTSNVTNMSVMMYNWTSIAEIGNIGVENFNISSLTAATNFASGSKFATSTYDTILVNWEAQPHNSNVIVHFGNSQYTLGSAAETARAALIADGWTISDGGGV